MTPPLLIYDIDTYVNPKVLRPADIRPGSDGCVPCFQVQGEHWSFVKLDENSWASNLAEKKRISNYASIGLYWFAQAGRYIQAYDRFFTGAENLVRRKRYIAPLYCQLLTEGAKISITDLPLEHVHVHVHVLGTPVELERFLLLSKKEIDVSSTLR